MWTADTEFHGQGVKEAGETEGSGLSTRHHTCISRLRLPGFAHRPPYFSHHLNRKLKLITCFLADFQTGDFKNHKCLNIKKWLISPAHFSHLSNNGHDGVTE